MMVRHQAALVSGRLTRVTSGVNLPSLEVIMSRPQSRQQGMVTAIWLNTERRRT
jgi:hypothetical protein